MKYVASYSIYGRTVTVKTNCIIFIEYYNFIFRDYIVLSPDIIDSFLYLFLKENQEIIVYDGRYSRLCVIPCEKQSSGLIKLILSQTLVPKIRGMFFLFHAAAVCMNDKGILIIGSSGAGKSTLALELVKNFNCLYFSDEFGILNLSTNLYPLTKSISCKSDIVAGVSEWESRYFGKIREITVPADIVN